MMTTLPVAGCRLQVARRQRAECATFNLQPSTFNSRFAFSLVEVLVVVSLLSLIVLALMAVFNSTQRAFRASVTQTDVLEGGRAAVELIAQDLRQIAPSGSYSNNAVNFFSLDNDYNNYLPALAYSPLVQTLPGSGAQRTNLLNYFFLLTRQNTTWTGIGYVVDATNTSPLYPLYRYYAQTNLSASPRGLFNNFISTINNGQWTNLSHLVDGVVHLAVLPNNPNGYALTNTYQYVAGQWVTNQNILFYVPVPIPGSSGVQSEMGYYFYSNAVPASIELQIGLLEDRPLQRASSLPFNSTSQLNYLKQQSGHVHLFRQQVTIPNLDPTAYQ
jgi:type II secretory pathway pseudopilin PulG